MDVTVICGPQQFFYPGYISARDVANKCGEMFRAPTAYWISGKCGRYSHRFLEDADTRPRLPTFARALEDNFGGRIKPVLIFPHVIDGENVSADADNAIEIVAGLGDLLPKASLSVTALELDKPWEDAVFPAPDALRACLAEITSRLARSWADAAAQEPIKIDGTRADDVGFVSNYVAGRLIDAVSEALEDKGFEVDPLVVKARIAEQLNALAKAGLRPSRRRLQLALTTLTRAVVHDFTKIAMVEKQRAEPIDL